MSTVASPLVTVEEYANLPEEEARKWELSEGELVPRYGDEMSARPSHQSYRGEIELALRLFFRENPIGRVYAEVDYRVAEGVVRRPDLSVVLKSRLPMFDDDSPIVEGVPDLAIEIASPSNRIWDTERKISQLLAAGCQAVWLLHPQERIAVIHSPGRRSQVNEDSALEDNELLPGFRLELRELFAATAA